MRSTSDTHPMGDVLLSLSACQFMNIRTHRNALFELTHLRCGELVMEFRLPHENNLYELATLRFQIRQHAQLFQNGRLEVLGLINNYHGVMAGGELIEEVGVQRVNIALTGRLAWLQTKIVRDGLQEFHLGEVRIKDQRCRDSFIETFQQRTTEHCFARSHFASNFDKPFALINTIQKVRQRFFMLCAQKQETRVRREVKRRFSQVKKR